MLEGKKIILGITGSIAAYKAALLTRLLIKAGANVQVVMTESATKFIPAITLSTLSKQKVLVELIDEQNWNNHVELGLAADLLLIAPASANTIAKMSNGICDNLLMAIYLSAKCPVAFAPAMDLDMWLHPSTKKNVEQLQSFGNHLIDVEDGELASGLVGKGRMAEPETILNWVENYFVEKKNLEKLGGKKILIPLAQRMKCSILLDLLEIIVQEKWALRLLKLLQMQAHRLLCYWVLHNLDHKIPT